MTTIRKPNSGFTLLEMLLAGSIMSIVILGVLFYARVTQEDTRTTEAINIVSIVVQASNTWLQGSYNTKQLSIGSLYNAKLLPASFANCGQTSGNCAANPHCRANPWYGDIFVSGVNTQSGITDSHIKITICNIPAKTCNGLSDKLSHYASNEQCQPQNTNQPDTRYYFHGVF